MMTRPALAAFCLLGAALITPPQPDATAAPLPDKRPLSDLKTTEPAWAGFLKADLIKAGDRVVWKPAPPEVGDKCLHGLQVTDRSPMGGLAANTGGLLIDRGWLRVLGASVDPGFDGLDAWNTLHDSPPGVLTQGYLIVGHDVLGGLFAVNGGSLEGRPGSVNYFAPDSLRWEDLKFGYSGWLQWALEGDIDRFYDGFRWKGWQKEVAAMTPNQGVSFYPPLWSREAASVDACSRRAVPQRELVAFHHSAKNLPTEGPVVIQPVE